MVGMTMTFSVRFAPAEYEAAYYKGGARIAMEEVR